MMMRQPSDRAGSRSTAMSLGDLIAGAVSDYRPLILQDVLFAHTELPVPVGWHVASAGISADQPVRSLVTGHRSRGGWQGCDTLAAFGFTGTVPQKLGVANASCTLRALGAAGIRVDDLDVSQEPDMWAVRSTGYFTATGLRMWAQFSTYVASSPGAHSGRLIEHTVFIVTQRRTQLRSDIEQLSDSAKIAFAQLKRGFHPGQLGPSG